MNEQIIKNQLYTFFPKELVNNLIDNYKNALSQYKKENWDYFGNDVGKFNETAFRMLEYVLNGSYTSIKQKLPIFNDKILQKWENSPKTIDESYRIVMPRVLYSMYCIRNKRGMIHVNDISPSKSDATLLLYNMKWFISELLRLNCDDNIDEIMKAIQEIMNKESNIIWNVDNVIKILDTSINIKDKILILLYVKNEQTIDELFENASYSNKSIFKKAINSLEKELFLIVRETQCIISPKGINLIENKYFK